jgi:hypothetical protein
VDTEFHLRPPASQHESTVHLFTADLRGVPRLRKAFSLLTPDNVAQAGWARAGSSKRQQPGVSNQVGFAPRVRLSRCTQTVTRGSLVHVIQYDLVYIAPAPTLTGLEGAHDGMAGAMEMFGGVFTGRLVATADVAALQA